MLSAWSEVAPESWRCDVMRWRLRRRWCDSQPSRFRASCSSSDSRWGGVASVLGGRRRAGYVLRPRRRLAFADPPTARAWAREGGIHNMAQSWPELAQVSPSKFGLVVTSRTSTEAASMSARRRRRVAAPLGQRCAPLGETWHHHNRGHIYHAEHRLPTSCGSFRKLAPIACAMFARTSSHTLIALLRLAHTHSQES